MRARRPYSCAIRSRIRSGRQGSQRGQGYIGEQKASDNHVGTFQGRSGASSSIGDGRLREGAQAA
jgi:hypothetical protein